MHCCKLILGSTGTFLGFVILVVSLVIHFWLPTFVKDEIKKTVSVTGPTAPGYKNFRNATEEIDLYEAYYLYNVENPVAFENGDDSHIRVGQRGPYVFKLKKYKPEVNTSWRTDGTVFYLSQTEYTFVPEMSATDYDNTNLTTYRMGLFGGIKHLAKSNQSDFLNKFEADMFNECICGKYKCESWLDKPVYGPFINLTAKQFLMGYDDPMLACAGTKLFNMIGAFTSIINQPATSSSSKALSGVYSGGKSSKTVKNPAPPNKENEMMMYLGMTELPYWGSKYANMLNGTAGTSLQPGQAKVGGQAYIWVDDFYRSVTVHGTNTEKLHGVELVRYTLDMSSMTNMQTNPDNAAFYINTTGIQPTPPNVENPVHFSKPYFLDADQTLINVNYSQSKQHDLFKSNPLSFNVELDFEPHTGALLRVHKRLQANVEFKHSSVFPSTRTWPSTLAPVFWVDEYYTMSKKNVDDIKDALFVPLTAAKFGGIVGACIGAVILFVGICLCYRGCSTSDEVEDLDDGFNKVPNEKSALVGDTYDEKQRASQNTGV